MQARGLVKRYGEREALKGVDFAAEPGELVAVIGPNGAGKTTLLSILAGTLRADAGTVDSPNGDVGWVPQQAALYRRLTVEENLLLFARLEKREDPDGAVEEMLELTGLRERRREVVARLSGGN
ncbi:MAG TPA: ATP-binding cassette domain-containing protein, partial [Solirubrobacterales bacterium]|nr:ATP-binding cassette domain-containing protein [Solirubrobacterales bacterium]